MLDPLCPFFGQLGRGVGVRFGLILEVDLTSASSRLETRSNRLVDVDASTNAGTERPGARVPARG